MNNQVTRSTHAGTFLVGTLVLLGVVFLTSAEGSLLGDARSLLLQIAPQPRAHVTLEEGLPYTVPVGQLLTLKAFSCTGDQPSDVRILVDGQPLGFLRVFHAVFDEAGVSEIPFGITIGAGKTVDFAPTFGGSPDHAVVYGYLSDL